MKIIYNIALVIAVIVGIATIGNMNREVTTTENKGIPEEIKNILKKESKRREIEREKNRTLKEYKAISKDKRDILITNSINHNKWDIKDKQHYINCMGDFSFSKGKSLKYSKVLQWCNNEKRNDAKTFKSHFNELDAEDLSNKAYVLCKTLVKKKLFSPSTANFPWGARKIFRKGHNKYIVESYVDSQNRYSAIIRTHWSCSAGYKGSGETMNHQNWTYSFKFF